MKPHPTSSARALSLSALVLLALAGCAVSDTDSGADSEVSGDTGVSAEEPVGEAAESLVTDCPWTAPAIDVRRELIINDLSVVNDPCRTSWTAPVCAAGTLGAWTFGKLMTSMAGSRSAAQFVAEWLHNWEVGATVNGFNVPPRPGIRPQLIDKWLTASGCAAGAPIVGAGACALDLKKAPFRLLAITNRVDIGGTVGSGAPGEARFVFGAFDLNNGAPLPATVILEYSLPTATSTSGWASLFHGLGSVALPSPAFNTQLQGITDKFAAAGVQAGNPNLGSAIGQVRTNEIAFGPVWEMREQRLSLVSTSSDELLKLTTVKQTPANNLNNAPALNNWLGSSGVQASILAETDTVPASFNGAPILGGAVTSPPGFFWRGPLSADARHLFGLGTCNGCHTAETHTNFTHIAPRGPNQPAPLSPFLAVSAAPAAGNKLPASVFTFTDPQGVTRKYNEPWRRVCEMRRLLNGVAAPWTKPSGGH
ncbi:MAG: hypothetical protein QM820_61380 [Minicystis sp.]